MKLNEMESFLAVADAGSVQAAARRLGVTQSAVSRLVQRLESEIGADLFDRSSKPFRLTRAGENALVHCRRVLRAVDDFSSAFAADAQPRGPFRLGLSFAVSSEAARRPVEHIRKQFPELSIRLSSDWSERLVDRVRDGDLDAAIVLMSADREPAADLMSRRLSRERVRIIAPATLEATRVPDLESMNDVGWVLLPEGCRYRAAITKALEHSREPLNVAVETFGQDLLILLVAEGAGLGLVPASMLAQSPHADKVRIIDTPGFRLQVSFWLVRGHQPGWMSPVMDAVEGRVLDTLDMKHSAFS